MSKWKTYLSTVVCFSSLFALIYVVIISDNPSLLMIAFLIGVICGISWMLIILTDPESIYFVVKRDIREDENYGKDK